VDQAELKASLLSVVQQVAGCSSAPVVEMPGYHGLPFTTDFEDGSLADFRLSNDVFPFGTSGASASIATEGANHFLSIAPALDTTLAVAGGHEWTDVALHVKVRLADDTAQAALRLRFDPLAKSYVMLNLASGLFKVRQRGAGLTTDVFSPSPKPLIVADTWYDIAFSVIGEQVSVSLDGVLVGNATITGNSPRGGLALGSLEGGVDFDDVSATAP
jgi:hypothetical protein